jgi:hypothetical protein
MPRSKNAWSYTSTSPVCFHGVDSNKESCLYSGCIYTCRIYLVIYFMLQLCLCFLPATNIRGFLNSLPLRLLTPYRSIYLRCRILYSTASRYIDPFQSHLTHVDRHLFSRTVGWVNSLIGFHTPFSVPPPTNATQTRCATN